MMRISVVGTIHEDVGLANSSALLALLLQLQPQVIFLEMPRSAITDFFGGPRSNLESIAVIQYRAHRQVELVPVDLPTPDGEFFSDMDMVRRSVRSKSVDYCRLVSRDEQYVSAHGFDYLNSSHSCSLTAEIHAAILEGLATIGDPRLSNHYELFTDTNARRDDTMLSNIESYCAGSSFDSGVFLIGAAHRKSLWEKCQMRASAESAQVEWNFVGSV